MSAPVLDLPRAQPLDQHHRTLVDNVHPPDWVNPKPQSRYDPVVVVVVVVVGGGGGGGGAGTAGLVASAWPPAKTRSTPGMKRLFTRIRAWRR